MASNDDNTTSQDKSESALADAISKVEANWSDTNAWDTLANVAEETGQPEAVANLYRNALELPLPKGTLSTVAEGAVDFFDEWYGDEPEAVNAVLTRIISLDIGADWAFDRLTEYMTVRERWEDLYAVYDQVLSRDIDLDQRKSLLKEVSDIAKDIADNPTKALEYLMTLQSLDRENIQRFKLIERMLERQEQWLDLIVLWEGQIPLMSDADAKQTKIDIAKCYVDKLADLEKAYDTLKAYLNRHPGDEAGCEETDRILKDERLSLPLRLKVLDLLVDNLDTAERRNDAVKAIETTLDFADEKSSETLHRRAGNRLALLNRDEEAIAHYTSLLLLNPGDADALKNLRILAVRARRMDLRAKALVDAAEASEDDALKVTHLTDAANIYADALNERDVAIDVFQKVLAISDLDPSIALKVHHKLNDLFAGAGRKADRLRTLEQIAGLENTHALRRTVIVEAARLAEDLTEIERAMSLWDSLLQSDPNDMEAIGAVIDLLALKEDFATLTQTLERRADGPVLPEQRRTDLIRSADVYEKNLENKDKAIEVWKTVFNEFGPRDDAIKALDSLLTESDRFDELDELLEKASEGNFEQMGDIYLRLADINAAALENLSRAFDFYYKVLVIDPSSKRAIDGIYATISQPTLARKAVDALVTAHRLTDNWQKLLDLTDVRLETARDEDEKVAIYLEAADLQKDRADNPEAARDLLTRALPLDPENQKIEAEAIRLAKVHGGWNRTALALAQAASSLEDNPHRKAHLKYQEGTILENELDKKAESLVAYLGVLDGEKRNPSVYRAIARVATELGEWKDATEAFLALVQLEDRIDDGLLAALHDAANTHGAVKAMVDALKQTLKHQPHIKAELKRDLELFVATTYLKECDDSKSAEKAAARAVTASPRHLQSMQLLADIQRINQSADLIGTLESIFELADTNLDPLKESAALALQTLEDNAEKRRHMLGLYEAASRMWRLGKKATGAQSRQDCCRFATWEIAKLDESRGLFESAAELLLSSAALPYEPTESRRMRRKAAALFSENGQLNSAIDVYMTVWELDRDDLETLHDLDRLLEDAQRFADLLSVKQRLLQLTDNPETKINIRLEIARLTGILEGSGERIEVLKSNLDERPGHMDSIDALTDIMTSRRMYEELVALYESQAERLSKQGTMEIAGELMMRASKILEDNLKDIPRAMTAFARVVDFTPNAVAMDALARLNIRENKLPHTVSWLKRRLNVSKPQERISVLLRLARAQLKLNQRTSAQETLEIAFEESPRNPEVRQLLLSQYREMENFEALAGTLSRATSHLSNPAVVLSYSKEAADIYFFKLHVLGRAVSVLERAVELSPEDEQFKVMLAEALVADEQYERAEGLLNEMLKGYGRRRSPERAKIHMLLAMVAKSNDDMDEAISQLELASTMDTHNVAILKTLAELTRDIGKLDRAERAYRSLLLLVRRETLKDGESPVITASEILFELSFLAATKGQAEKAKELEESAFESVTSDSHEINRIKLRMEQMEAYPLLVRIFENLLTYVDQPIRKAQVLSQLAEVLEGPLERKDEAFEMRLTSLREDPSTPAHHDAAEALAKDLGKHDTYIKLLDELISKARRDGDGLKRCELLLRLAKVHVDAEDTEKAWELFEQAKSLGVREVDVLKLGVKLARAKGDNEHEIQMLSELSSMGEDDMEADTRTDAMYRLAEIHLARPETFDDGTELFEQAFTEDPKHGRAGRILMRVLKTSGPNERLLRIFEKVARESDDEAMKLEYLDLKASLPSATPSMIREGAELALMMNAEEQAEVFMRRMIEAREEGTEDKQAVTWAVLTLAERRKDAGDPEGALNWLMDAGDIVTVPDIFDIGLKIGEQAAKDDHTDLAIRIYKWLLEFDPSARAAWEPLAALYTKTRDLMGFEALVDESLYTIEDPKARNDLRLMYAKLLMIQDGRKSDGLDVLKNIQLDEPDHQESMAMIVAYYQETNQQDDLIEFLEYRLEGAKENGDAAEVRTVALALSPLVSEKDTEKSIAIYRDALSFTPNDKEILQGLLHELKGDEHIEERAKIREQMLHTEDDDNIGRLAIEVATEFETLQDEQSAHRVLMYGYQRAKEDEALKAALEKSFRNRGDFRGLADLFSTAAETIENPNDRAEAYKEIADISRDQLQDLMREIEALKEAHAALPNEISIILRLLNAFSDANRYEEAIEKASDALGQFEEKEFKAALLNFRGNLLRTVGNLSAAVTDLKEAFDLLPNVAAGNLEKALIALKDQYRSEGDSEGEKECVLTLLLVLEYGEKREEMRELLITWLERDPDDINAWKRLLKIESDEENWEGIATICEKLIEITEGEEQLKAAIWLSQACSVSGNLQTAKRGLEMVFEQNPENEDVRNELRAIYEKTEALPELAKMLMEDAEDADKERDKADLLRRAGDAFFKAGETESAMTALKKALDITPDDGDTCRTLIDIYMDREELDEANALADQAIAAQGGRRSKELSKLQLRKALIASAYGDRSQELAWLEQAFVSNRTDGDIACLLADLAEEMEEWDLAQKALKQISILKTDHAISRAEAYFRQGKISFFQEDDKKRAMLYIRKAISEDPDYDEAKRLLEAMGDE